MSAYTRRRARTARRFGLVGPVLLTWEIEHRTAEGKLTLEQRAKYLEEVRRNFPGWSSAAFKAEIELARVGQNRKSGRFKGRPPVPRNSNNPRMGALARYDPDLIYGDSQLGKQRISAALRWLKAHRPALVVGLEISTLGRAIRRARQKARQPR